MSLKEQIHQAAAEGHQQKDTEDRSAAVQRADTERQRALELQILTDAANRELRGLAVLVRAAAHSGETLCTAHFVPMNEIDFPREYYEDEPLDPGVLKRVSLRVFEILKEQELNPSVVRQSRGVYVITIPVPQATA